jgi:hypothetical protein
MENAKILLSIPKRLLDRVRGVLGVGETVTGFANGAIERAVNAREPISNLDDINQKFAAMEGRLRRVEAGLFDDGK